MYYKVKIKKSDGTAKSLETVKLSIVEEMQLEELVDKFFKLDFEGREKLLKQLN